LKKIANARLGGKSSVRISLVNNPVGSKMVASALKLLFYLGTAFPGFLKFL